jgi:trimeric autotransporter adhesin
MLFPDNPTNGQQANINGVVYTYSSTLSAWTVTSNFSGNVTVNQINANAIVSANTIGATTITATTFVGSGSQLTGVVSPAIVNGTSNVSVASNGNITTTVNGNVATVVSSSGIQSQFVTSPRVISANTTISGDVNAMTAGPITIAPGIVVTIANGSEWSIV